MSLEMFILSFLPLQRYVLICCYSTCHQQAKEDDYMMKREREREREGKEKRIATGYNRNAFRYFFFSRSLVSFSCLIVSSA
jgi:hypothetical protein